MTFARLGHRAIVVLAEELLETIVMPWIEAHGGIAATPRGRSTEERMPEVSAIDRLSFDASRYVTQAPESIRRTLWKMRSETLTFVPANIADAFALASGNLLAYSELTHLPTSILGARAMVDAYAETHEPDMTIHEQHALAEQLLHFASGVIAAYDTDAACAERAKQANKTRRDYVVAEAA